MSKTNVNTVDVRDKIMEHLNSIERKLPWLSDKTGISYNHLYFIFVRRERELTDENKDIINSILKTSF